MALYIKLFDFASEGCPESIMFMDKLVHQTELGKRLMLITLIQEL